MTAHPGFDGTFSLDAVASAAHALVERLHDEAMATIAALADTWDRPAQDAPADQREAPVTYQDPATWSVVDDEDDEYDGEDDDDVRVLPLADLSALFPLPRRTATVVTARDERQLVA